MKVNMSSCMPGCVFEYCGRVPESVYQTETFNSPLEQTIYCNDISTFKQLIKEGASVSVKVKMGQMSCFEYCAMMGYNSMLKLLLDNSINATTLKKYFHLDDVVERAYLISRNKQLFLDQAALAEANRYEAALYIAVEYDRPECVDTVLDYLGRKDLGKHSFYVSETTSEILTACELANVRGHKECHDLLARRQERLAN